MNHLVEKADRLQILGTQKVAVVELKLDVALGIFDDVRSAARLQTGASIGALAASVQTHVALAADGHAKCSVAEHLQPHGSARRTADVFLFDGLCNMRDLLKRQFAGKNRDIGPAGVKTKRFDIGNVELRGKMEIEALQKVRHVIGRTQWDKACTWNFHPEVKYHFCNETLRQPFYEGHWHYDTCKKYRIFASSCAYPIKGFHRLLEAFAEVVKQYPDATLAVPGRSFLSENWKERLHLGSYEIYLRNLVRQHNLAGRISFLGDLSAEQMREAFLEANVFVMPSSIENSSNSLGEAMLLGMPCVASNVGGTKELVADGREGYLYQSTASYLLAYHIQQIFAMEKQAEMLGQAARSHAMRTHDPETNLKTLLEIYQSLL